MGVFQWATVSFFAATMAATLGYGVVLYWGTALRATAVPGVTKGHEAMAALGEAALGVVALGAAALGVAALVAVALGAVALGQQSLSSIRSYGEKESNMGVIFTNSHAVNKKLRPLSIHRCSCNQ